MLFPSQRQYSETNPAKSTLFMKNIHILEMILISQLTLQLLKLQITTIIFPATSSNIPQHQVDRTVEQEIDTGKNDSFSVWHWICTCKIPSRGSCWLRGSTVDFHIGVAELNINSSSLIQTQGVMVMFQRFGFCYPQETCKHVPLMALVSQATVGIR